MREILRRVFQEGKFYHYECERWIGYGYRLGQLQYETRFYRDGAVRSRFWGPGISETWGREGEMKLGDKTCKTCAVLATCPKPTVWDDHCQDWQDPQEPNAQLWEALQKAMAEKDLNKLVQTLNHRYLNGVR